MTIRCAMFKLKNEAGGTPTEEPTRPTMRRGRALAAETLRRGPARRKATRTGADSVFTVPSVVLADVRTHLVGCGQERLSVEDHAAQGKRAEKLRVQGGWSAKSAVFWGYVADGEKWEDAATEGIGL